MREYAGSKWPVLAEPMRTPLMGTQCWRGAKCPGWAVVPDGRLGGKPMKRNNLTGGSAQRCDHDNWLLGLHTLMFMCRWGGGDEDRILSLGHGVHLLEKAGHWVHTGRPSTLHVCSCTIQEQLV